MENRKELFKGFVKGCLIVLNSICFFAATSTFFLAAVDNRILKHYGAEQAGSETANVIILITCVMLMFVSMLGCIGAVKNHVKMLHLYVIYNLVIAIMEMLLAIYVSVQRYGFQLIVFDWMQEDFYRNFTGNARGLHEHDKDWDEMQSSYFCCGLNGPEDYGATGRPISVSCCDKAYRAGTVTAQNYLYQACLKSATYYSIGCRDEVIEMLREGIDFLLGAVLICFWVEVLGMTLAMWMVNYVKNSKLVYVNTVKY